MVKPIFTILIPESIINTVDDLNEIERKLQEKLYDYHVIVCSEDREYIEFNCYNGKMYNKTSKKLETVIRNHFEKTEERDWL